MSIYRRTDRVPLNDLAVGAGHGPHGAAAEASEDWAKRRASQPASGLLRPTVAWATSLPAKVQPTALLAKFPRVANLVAVLWKDPDSLRRYVDDLLVDKRGNRQGFPVDILREIFELRAYFDQLHPPALHPWEVMNKDE
jgi:hypothetical protein